MNLDEYKNIGTYWFAVYIKNNKVIYFDNFGVEYIPKDIKKLIGHKDIKTNVFSIQDYDSIMCGYFCILFIDCMLTGKSLTDLTDLFSSSDFLKNDKIVLIYFK